MSKLRIAFVTHFPSNPHLPKGGVESVSVTLVKALSRFEDLDIHVVSLNAKGDSRVKELGKITLHSLPKIGGSALLNAISRGRRLIQTYLRALEPDLIHAHDTYGIMVKGIDIPRVFTIHGFIHADTIFSERRPRRLRALLWKFIEESAWADQPNIISISPYVRERLSGIAKGYIYDIDNPIEEKFFHIKRSEKKGNIFCAAVISPRKNILALVRAISKLKRKNVETELRIAGHVISEEYKSLIISEALNLGIKDNVKFLGTLSVKDVARELSHACVFALVSLEENSPLVIEEAAAAGVPIITSNRCGMPYMVEHGESGFLVNAYDVDEIAHRLEQILRDDNLRKKMGEAGKKIALMRFHPMVVTEKTRSVYFDVLERERLKGGVGN